MRDLTVQPFLVFGGWSFPTHYYRQYFGTSAAFIDINPIMPELLTNERLRDNWAEICFEKVRADMDPALLSSRHACLAGWSTGAILAAALAKRIQPAGICLLSSTPSFCSRPGFSHGTQPSRVAAMRSSLRHDPETTLNRFARRCGLPDSHPFLESANSEHLMAGLHFLEQVDIRNIPPFSCPAWCIHGEEDRIIPSEAGRILALRTGAQFSTVPGGHCIFGVPEARKRMLSLAVNIRG